MYFSFSKQKITDFSDTHIESLYNEGWVFTREERGSMDKIKSVRIDLEKFELTSENKRILKKTDFLSLTTAPLPLTKYSWEIGKMAKDFYASRGAQFSANKIKELFTNESNFTTVLLFKESEGMPLGYVICFSGTTILHYSYPFFDYLNYPKDTGLGMMIRAITYAQETGKKYVYLGSLSNYKLQFRGIEVYDGKCWISEREQTKELLVND